MRFTRERKGRPFFSSTTDSWECLGTEVIPLNAPVSPQGGTDPAVSYQP